MFITHDLDEALQLGDQIEILNGGRLVQNGKLEDILMNPADDYVEAFVTDVNRSKVIRASSIMHAVDTAGAAIKLSELPTVEHHLVVEAFLPLILETKKPVAILGDNNDIIGYVTEKELLKVLRS